MKKLGQVRQKCWTEAEEGRSFKLPKYENMPGLCRRGECLLRGGRRAIGGLWGRALKPKRNAGNGDGPALSRGGRARFIIAVAPPAIGGCATLGSGRTSIQFCDGVRDHQ